METPSMLCHPERSMAVSEANRHTESKDPCPASTAVSAWRNSHDVIDSEFA